MSFFEIDPSWRIPLGSRAEYAIQLNGPVVDAVEQEAWMLGVDAGRLIRNFGLFGSVMLENAGAKKYILTRPNSSVGEEIHFMESRFDPLQVDTERSFQAQNTGYNILIVHSGIDFIMECANKHNIDIETMYARFMKMGVHILREERMNRRRLYEQEEIGEGVIKLVSYKFNWKE